MCKFKSGIILKNSVILAPMYNDSHSSLLNKLGIEDTRFNAESKFVRAELYPENNDRATHPKTWKFHVDQDIVPEWFTIDRYKYEEMFREAVIDWWNKNIWIMAGYAWTKLKTDDNGTYFMLADVYEKSEFGENNNYAESFIREKLNLSKLAVDMKKEFGDKLVPIHLDLTSLDGLKDYGTLDDDLFAIPNFDLYRECRENIPNSAPYYLSTPDSTPSGYGSDCVRFVFSYGRVGYSGYCWNDGVRPFCIINL